MKKLVVLLITLVMILYSCSKEIEHITHYGIVNLSSQDIEIKIPNYFLNSLTIFIDTTFHLSVNQELEFSFEGVREDNTHPFNSPDTAFIIFNDKDTVIYTQSNNSPYNVLKKENYNQEKIIFDDSKHTSYHHYFYYAFTEEDYQNAINVKK